MTDYEQDALVAVSELGYSAATLDALVEHWTCFVQGCAEGYSFGRDEYANDAFVRKCIERALSIEPRNSASRAAKERFQLALEHPDQMLRALFSRDLEWPGQRDWWLRGVLLNATSDDYQEEVATRARRMANGSGR
jgi:hypothetical protein